VGSPAGHRGPLEDIPVGRRDLGAGSFAERRYWMEGLDCIAHMGLRQEQQPQQPCVRRRSHLN
jgi:hypothetical protein